MEEAESQCGPGLLVVSARGEPGFSQGALQLVDAGKHGIAFGATVVSGRKPLRVVVTEALHQLSEGHRLVVRKVEDDAFHRPSYSGISSAMRASSRSSRACRRKRSRLTSAATTTCCSDVEITIAVMSTSGRVWAGITRLPRGQGGGRACR